MKIAIIGFGRFGKLFADIMKQLGEVHIISSSGQSCDFPLIDYKDLGQMDWVIPAVPISHLRETLQKIAPELKAGALTFDVSSVKVLPCQWLKEVLPTSTQIIGTHPMFGPDSAKNGLKGLQIVLCPIRQETDTLEKLRTFFDSQGLKVIETTAEEHDRQAAKCLSLVHFLGRGLSRLPVKRQEISTLGFERLLTVNETVSNDTWQLFFDMQKYNPYSKQVRTKMIEALIELDNEITNQEVDNELQQNDELTREHTAT